MLSPKIYRINPDGTIPPGHRLTNNSVYDTSPDWSSDASEIVYSSGSGTSIYLYTMNADGSNQSQIPIGTYLYGDSQPDWEPIPYTAPSGNVIAVSDSGSLALAGELMPLVVPLEEPSSTPGDGTCSLKEAIELANAISGSGTTASAGDCLTGETDSRADVVVGLTSNATYFIFETFTLTGDLLIEIREPPLGLPPQNTTLFRDGVGGRIFNIASGASLTLDNITLANGNVTGTGADGDGGGIYNAGTLTLQNGSAITGNTASGNGGGIYNASGATLTLNNTPITDNVAIGPGGGIYNAGTLQINGGCLVGNTGLDGSDLYSTVPVTADGIWWGRTSGPVGNAYNEEQVEVNSHSQSQGNCQRDYPVAICTATLISDDIYGLDRQNATTQEAFDMRAVVDTSMAGLTVHSSPTLNASKLSVVPWESQITVTSRLQFPISSNDPDRTAGQVWYQIDQPAGWILARITNVQPGGALGNPFEYYYIKDGDPCGNEVGAPNILTFPYDRQAAARYALMHAYRNSYAAVPNQPEYPLWVTTQLQARVTNYVDPSFTSGTQIDIPYVGIVPFAAFLHGDVTGMAGQTGSATFNSEALWMGGLPMTVSMDENGSPQASLCQDLITSQNAPMLGWRACPEEYAQYNPIINSTTPPWDDHTNLTRYYSKKNIPDSMHYALGDSDPGQDQRGELVAVFYLYEYDEGTDTYSWTQSPLAPIVGGTGPEQGFPNLDNPTNQQTFFDTFINEPEFLDNDEIGDLKNVYNNDPAVSGNISAIKVGDYVTVLSGGGHGFLVVGWGPTVSCPTALNNTYRLSSDGGLLYTDFQSAIIYGPLDNAVPYVVDFPGATDQPPNAVGVPQLQRPRARPFYCSAYSDPNFFQTTGISGGFWRFYTFPDSVTIPTEGLYTPPTWQWDAAIEDYSEISN